MYRHSILFLLFLLASGCKLFDPAGGASNQAVRVVADLSDPDIATDAAELSDVRLEGTTLRLKASFSGGCAQHDFVLYGTMTFGKSNPPTTSIRLGHDAHGDACEAYLTQEIAFDLTRLVRAWRGSGQHGPIRIVLLPPHADESAATLALTL